MWTDPRLPLPEHCVLRPCLDRKAVEHPDRIYAVFADGESWTYVELRKRVRSMAANLQRMGVGQGDTVLSWLPNGSTSLCLLFAVNYLGAVFAPLNTEYRGELLGNAIRASRARLLVAHSQLHSRLAAIEAPTLAQIELVDEAALLKRSGEPDDAISSGALPWDVHVLVATSGTTGASKFVPIRYAQTHATSGGFVALTASDRALLNLPMFHVGGIGIAFRALYRGGSIAIVESFSAATFWSTVRRFEITTLTLLGAMTNFLLGEAPRESDRDHTLKHVVIVPLEQSAQQFSRRFGVDIYTVFNMTEVSCPIVSEKNPQRIGTCGRAREGYELRLVDENDCEVALGAVGELIVRADTPWAIATEYLGDPVATAQAWRNGWFHTGDRFTRDEGGYFYFVDRLKDAIRRRGENVSAVEVESAIAGFQDVREVAVVAVPSEVGEDELLAAISPAGGASIDCEALIAYLTEKLPHFMVPRYVRLMSELPKTSSLKVIKQRLRDDGVTADTWDRERAGLRLRRTRFADGG